MCVHVFISSTLIHRASAAAQNLSYECKWRWRRLSLGFSSPSAHSMPSTASGYSRSRSLTLYMCVCVWVKLFEHDLGLCVCVSRHTALPWVAVGVADWLRSENKWKHATKRTRAAIGTQNRKFWSNCLSSTSISLKNTFKCTSVAQLQPTMTDFNMTNHSNYYVDPWRHKLAYDHTNETFWIAILNKLILYVLTSHYNYRCSSL